MGSYQVRENGHKCTVEVKDDRLIRTHKMLVGGDDVDTILLEAITGVRHDRKTLGNDRVHIDRGSISVDVGGISYSVPITYEWKAPDAESMVAEIRQKMYGAGLPPL